MCEGRVNALLASFGLTAKEIDIYIYISKRGALKCSEIAKELRKNRPQIYRILDRLEHKNMIQRTIESPARFAAVPFETIFDLNIKEKKEQAAMLKQTKKEYLECWRSIPKQKILALPEKISTVQGQKKIHPKILQLVEKAKKELIIAIDLDFDPQLEIEMERTLKRRRNKGLKVWILRVDSRSQTLELQRRDTKGKNRFECYMGKTAEIPTGFIVTDQTEAVFFIKKAPFQDYRRSKEEEVCVWTDSKVIICILRTLFEKLWINARNNPSLIDSKLTEIGYSEKAIGEVSKWYAFNIL